MISTAFWQGKRVLITGHTGFKGTWATFWLKQLGAKICGVSLEPNTQPSAFHALELAQGIEHHILDIRNAGKLADVIKAFDPELVLHMAAQPLVRASYRNPLETYETNVIGTGNLLWALKDSPSVRSIVVITTDKCYENKEWVWAYRETDGLGGHDPYSSSKACAEILTASFRKSFFTHGTPTGPSRPIGLASVRAGNVIGGGDWSEDRLLPDAVRSLQNSQRMEIRYPESIRPWQHVLVPLSGYLMLAEKLWSEPTRYSEAYNFAPDDDDCIPVQYVLDKFGSAWGRKVDWFTTPGPKAHEAHFLKLDSNKAKSQLKWHPVWNLDQALKASADWYRCYYEKPQDLKELTRTQIAQFTERL
jgi:CDP-glucose 4,6-dehydratase